MAQKIKKIQIGYTVLEQVIEVPDAEPARCEPCEAKPKRRGRKPKAMDDPQTPEAPALDD